MSELDQGVFRVSQPAGPAWVARIFPAARPVSAVAGDAEILRFLAGHRFRAERPAASDPVSELDGQGVLVTEYVDDVPRQQRRDEIRRLGGFWTLGVMLGELHTLPGSDGSPRAPGAIARPGGAWHHLAEGLPRDEIAAAARILDEAEERIPATERKAYAALRAQVAGLDGGDGLPHALTHPDFVLANVIPSPSRGMVMVDWTGSGQGPRLWSLAFLLYAAGGRGLNRVDSAIRGYLTQVQPEPEELDRLAGLIRVRPAMFGVWAVGQGRKSVAEAWRGVTETRALTDAVAARALTAFGRGPSSLQNGTPRHDRVGAGRLHNIGTRPTIEGPSHVLAFPVLPGKEFEGPVEQVARGAPDHHAVERPVRGLHRVAALDLGGEPASRGALIIKAGGAVEEHH
jgi:Ser/Thr protein kinase RdoA (MazF antagonist)